MTYIDKVMNIFIMTTLAGLVMFWNQPIAKDYAIEAESVNEAIKIVHISDYHSLDAEGAQEKIINTTKEENPDIVVLTGDIYDELMDKKPADELVDSLVQDHEVYYVTGNHEYMRDDVDLILKSLADKGVHVLEGEGEVVHINGSDIWIAGIDDPKKKPTNAVEPFVGDNIAGIEIDEDKVFDYKILLSHRPSAAKSYSESGYDLILTGHSHGGQVRIPFFINGFYTYDESYFPKYAGGKYDLGDNYLIVSRGLANDKTIPRIFNPPEIVIIEIN